MRSCTIFPDLTATLIERWGLETRTFHLTLGKCTITLKDIAFILWSPIDGLVVAGDTRMPLTDVCNDYLGAIPLDDKIVGLFILHAWLDQVLKVLTVVVVVIDVQYAARALILRLIATILMVDKFGNQVLFHYLILLQNLFAAGGYKWEFYVLVIPYTQPNR
ncbi:protein MAIN-LIKE 2-like [Gossypium raimondii]|uniref:protein MAIN-LIKE 2-like n=1 Tax=Gossypium raimondii TaxID=29730 RepID=UPI00227A4F30|nr:protein MAIN-LIKE 2-like [Gossypium raimondii]